MMKKCLKYIGKNAFYHVFLPWTEPSIDGSHSRTNPRISTRETKTMDLMMKLGLSDPPHPLFPSDLWSNSATVMMLQPELEDQGTQQEALRQNDAVLLT